MTELARLVDRFEDVTVRDLACLLFAPDLLRASAAGAPLARPFASPEERDAVLGWLSTLDAAPDAFHLHARDPKFTRLGVYAESLLGYFIAHGPTTRLIAANVPLRWQRRTIGEGDFLLENEAGTRLHWELAVKFYLHIGDDTPRVARLADYVGPNLQDRFDLKHARLVTHQLALTSRAEFAALKLDGPWLPQSIVKDRLFYHGDAAPEVVPDVAPEVADDHLRGWWMTASEWHASHGASARDDHAWVVQPRMAWLASRRLYAADADALLADAATIHTQLASIAAPTMLASYARDDTGAWREDTRGFIVPDDWPERARAYAARTL
ncbi:hypothetical protein BVER_04294c [Candidatus Burkholderia verschuerenii]|uniref:DUF1853 family protein n=1 Tax=Candidatus Burkholderia verschuerenii TaxID=242163 RepID=A0A0L0MGE3_9BURK|nr:DUF1853 family protein [Candidatus Burkholderia verschuerenii]KND61393.1 hypothetical protein BVER_04294c [Candidatus Burkholderia verschuerenii]